MKSIKSLLSLAAISVITLGGLTGCQENYDNPPMIVPEATMKANTTIAELKEAFWKEDRNYADLCPYKNTDTKEEYIIKGRVISSDATGNVYKALYIQDDTAAITLSINQNSLYNTYRVGQEVVLNVTGLYIGKYAGLEQIGGLGDYNGTPQVSFMAFEDFEAHCELNGLPDATVDYVNYGNPLPANGNMYTIVTSFAELPTASAPVRDIMSQLVEFRNVHFAEGGNATYAEYQKATSRSLVDEAGNSIDVRTSGYATFYNDILPAGTGTVRGLLSYYNGSWQIVLRSTADCIFDSKGQKNDPYTVEEAIALEDSGAAGWVKGYIVGSVKPGVSSPISNNDIIWSADAEMDNTLVIGQTPETKTLAQCLVMELPSGSALRADCNLLDNPKAYGKEILVRGTLAQFLGTSGLVGNTGTVNEYQIDGMTGGGSDTPSTGGASGTGTVNDPYNVAKALEVAVANGTTSTVDVYTAGYVVSGSIDTSYGNGTFKIADQKGGSTTITVFRAKGPGNEKFTDANAVKVGDYIVVCAPIVNYMGNTPETNLGYIYSINGSTDMPQGGGTDTPDEPTGAGSQDEPYSVAYVQATTADQTGVWIEGYVVGYIKGTNYSSGATFSNDLTGVAEDSQTGYVNANFILGPAKTSDASGSCIPCNIKAGSARDVLGFRSNPDIYLKHVKVKGDITKYFGLRGVKNIAEYEILD